MFQSRRKWAIAAFAAPMTLFLVSGIALAQTFDEPLEKCQAVTTPAALTTCASSQDPFQGGGAIISDQGDVTVTLYGAATNTTYAVSLVSNDGTQTKSLGNLTTGANGDGALAKEAFFKLGTVGAGQIVLSSGAGEEFVTGLTVSNNGLKFRRDFQPGLVRCADVVVPASLSSCGDDPLTSGRVDVEEDDGAAAIHVSGARPNTSYTVLFVSETGTSSTLGTLGPTNNRGGGTLVLDPAFAAGTIGSGQIVLQNAGTTEFISGFKVDQKFVRPKVSASTLVACGTVTDPVLTSCGTDPLDSGSYKVETGGQVEVTLSGANPSTNYELFFRPLDNSGDQDTGIAVPTNANGDASVGPKPFFTSNTVASGTFVVKLGTLDEFDPGYTIH